MRLAYVCADFGVPLDGSKGASVHLRELVRGLSDLGHEVVILTPAAAPVPFMPSPGGTAASLAPTPIPTLGPGASCFTVGLDPAHAGLLEALKRAEVAIGHETRLRQELRNLLYNVSLLETGLEILRRRPVDAVYERYTLFVTAGLGLAHALGVPHLLEVNAPLADEQERTRGLELKALAHETERRILAGSDAVLVVSDPLADFARSCGVPESRVHVVPNAVDPRRFDPARSPQALPDPLRARLLGRRVIGFVGTLKPWHGMEILLEAFRTVHQRIPDTHLLVVGDGPGRGGLEDLVRRLGLAESVSLAGAVPHDQVPAYLAAMDVTVAPGSDEPGFYFSPIKIFEYLAMGKAVVAGRAPQLERLLPDQVVVLIEPGRADAMAESLEHLVRDREARRRLGEAARDWVTRERTWASNARRVVEIAQALRRPALGAAEAR
ncbi:MAG TPA: glycosyltransferase family 4 protein [Candidatus Eisenbacteria bacterium]